MAEFEKGELGGGESVLLGLLRGLATTASDLRISVLTTKSMQVATAGILPSPHQVISRPPTPSGAGSRFKRAVKPALNCIPGLMPAARAVLRRPTTGLPSGVDNLDDYSTSLQPDLVHWLYPLHYAVSKMPSVVTVHDLNYEHLPEHFSSDYIRWRRLLMKTEAHTTASLIAISDFVAQDVISRHPETHDKVTTIRWAPYVTRESLRAKPPGSSDRMYSLGCEYLLYPAATYEHKNHATLFQALHLLVNKHPRLKLVLTGPKTKEWLSLKHKASDLLDSGRLVHLGFVSEPELAHLYADCSAVVFPSLFEGAGLPVIEAISMGRPIACSGLTVFHEHGGDYPFYFDPHDPASIAAAVTACLRADQRPRPALRSWDVVAREHVELYHSLLSPGQSSHVTTPRRAIA